MFNFIYFIKINLIFIFISIPYSQNSDLMKMRSEYEKMKNNQTGVSESVINNNEDIDFGSPKVATISPYLLELARLDSLNKEQVYFGYDFFTKRDSVSFWENLPTLTNYLLGPGDELIISIWGETQLRKNYTISREGSIYDEKVGLLILAGKSLEEAIDYLKKQFTRAYATLGGDKPSTFIDISLGNLRSINVNFVGEVNFPGIYPIHPFSTLITGLLQAGGVDTTGTLRNIIIKRTGYKDQSIDLYDYFLDGTMKNSTQLRDQDVVLVSPRLSSVRIDSAVIRPGVYEAKTNETISDVIKFSGGLSVNASGIIGLSRTIPIQDRKTGFPLNKSYYIEYRNSSLTKIEDGDIITALKIYKSEEFVEIIGQVKNPSKFYYYDQMTAKDLINLSGGLGDSTFLSTVNLNKASLVRRDPESSNDKIIKINLSELIFGSYNISLENFDKLVIYPNKNYFERGGIKISGEINTPGYYPLFSINENLEKLIKRAGGLSSRALKDGISIYRDNKYFENPPEDKYLSQISNNSIEINEKENFLINNKKDEKIKLAWSGLDVVLMPGDSIIVKENIGAVYVFGEVYNPGLVSYKKNKNIRYYIDSAGGINNYGNRNNVVVIYPNGITKPWKIFNPPKIQSGSTIVIYRKADFTPFNLLTFATNSASIVSSVVTTVLLIKQFE